MAKLKAPGENGAAGLDDFVAQVIEWLSASKYRGAPDQLNALSALLIDVGELDLAHQVALANDPEQQATALARLAAHMPRVTASAKKAIVAAEVGDDYDVRLRRPRTVAACVWLDAGVSKAAGKRLKALLEDDGDLTPAIDALLMLGHVEPALEWLEQWIERKPLGGHMGPVADAKLVGRVAGGLFDSGDFARGKKLIERVPERDRHTALRDAADGLSTRPRKQIVSMLQRIPEGERGFVTGRLGQALRNAGRAADAEAIRPAPVIPLIEAALERGDIREARKLIGKKDKGGYKRLRYAAGLDDLDDAFAHAREALKGRALDAIKRLAYLYPFAARVEGVEGVERVASELKKTWKLSALRTAKKKRAVAAKGVVATEHLSRAQAFAVLDDREAFLEAIAQTRTAAKGLDFRASILESLMAVELDAGLPLEAYKTAKVIQPSERRSACHQLACAYLPDVAGAIRIIDELIAKDDRFSAGVAVLTDQIQKAKSGESAPKKKPAKKKPAKKKPAKKKPAKKKAAKKKAAKKKPAKKKPAKKKPAKKPAKKRR